VEGTMKKYLVYISIVLLTLVLVSCTGKQGATGPAGPEKAGVYYEGYFQQGVFPIPYSGQVEAELYGGFSGVTYTSNVYPLGIGTASSTIPYRSIVKFDISSLPKSKIMVDKAQLILNTDGNSAAGGAKNVSIYKVTNTWVVNQTGWDLNSYNLPITITSWVKSGGDFDPTTITANGVGIDLPPNSTITIDLNPATVLYWMENPTKNYGMIFIAADENNPNYSEIHSSGAVTITVRPQLKVWYYTTE
jgi:hypothetical protein